MGLFLLIRGLDILPVYCAELNERVTEAQTASPGGKASFSARKNDLTKLSREATPYLNLGMNRFSFMA
jgi:hypothetical protein